MYRHEGFECSLRIIHGLLTEEQMVIIHRISLEISKARNTIDLNSNPSVGFGFAGNKISAEDMWLDAYLREDEFGDIGGANNEGA